MRGSTAVYLFIVFCSFAAGLSQWVFSGGDWFNMALFPAIASTVTVPGVLAARWS